MTLVQISGGLHFPNFINLPLSLTPGTIDAATEKYAMIGRLYIDGRPSGSKTLSSGTIQWRSASGVVFSNGSTTVDIGIQDVATGAGPIAQPDGTFDVKTTLTGGGGGITSNAWQTTTMNSGTKTMSHGDMIAVVWDMTARGGSDVVNIQSGASPFQSISSNNHIPTVNAFVSSAWQTTSAALAGRIPSVIIVFDDGTLGWMDGCLPISSQATEQFSDSVNPDERGIIFQVPWKCKIDQFWMYGGPNDANADFTLKLYSSPTSSPALIASIAVLAEQCGIQNNTANLTALLPSEISLATNTDYLLTVLATGTTNVRLFSWTLGNTAHRAALTGGTSIAKATRDGSSGNFTAESPATTIYALSVRVSQIDDGMGTPPPTYRIGI